MREGEGTSLYGLYRYVQPQRVWFTVVWVINRASISAILINRVQFLHPSLEVGMYSLEEATFSSLSIMPSRKARRNLCQGQAYRYIFVKIMTSIVCV